MSSTAATATEISPFHFDVPGDQLAELRKAFRSLRT